MLLRGKNPELSEKKPLLVFTKNGWVRLEFVKTHISREPGNRTIKLSTIYISAEGPQAAFLPKKAIRRSPRIRSTSLNSLIIVAKISKVSEMIPVGKIN
jgi:hypothetical protein